MPGLFDIPPFDPAQDLRDIRPQLEALRAAVLALRPGHSPDILPHVSARGTTFRLVRKPGVGGTSGACPFDITITETAGPVYTATFRAGTVNQLLPSNYLTGVTVPATGTRYLVLNCTVSSGAITAASFTADSSVPPAIAPYAGEPPTSFKVLIGVVTDTVATKVWSCGNISAIPVEAFRLQKSVPVAGQVPYDVYYTWEIGVLADA